MRIRDMSLLAFPAPATKPEGSGKKDKKGKKQRKQEKKEKKEETKLQREAIAALPVLGYRTEILVQSPLVRAADFPHVLRFLYTAEHELGPLPVERTRLNSTFPQLTLALAGLVSLVGTLLVLECKDFVAFAIRELQRRANDINSALKVLQLAAETTNQLKEGHVKCSELKALSQFAARSIACATPEALEALDMTMLSVDVLSFLIKDVRFVGLLLLFLLFLLLILLLLLLLLFFLSLIISVVAGRHRPYDPTITGRSLEPLCRYRCWLWLRSERVRCWLFS